VRISRGLWVRRLGMGRAMVEMTAELEAEGKVLGGGGGVDVATAAAETFVSAEVQS